ncbi:MULTISPECIES: DUF433 domain-containing protein [unclassified Microcoleus]|uniref:DUF433 domain-containing protein n=1 Tax=unclassified Microcoleus TaxID=2642155 RepID=UPI0025ED899A|nr:MULTISPECIES: DUF433 domain-containing protein [unclassified Microcoleus]
MDNQLWQRITLDPNICHGKPCIRRLRYPVELILELLCSGMNAKEIIDDCDDLEDEDIYAAIVFVVRTLVLINILGLKSSLQTFVQ